MEIFPSNNAIQGRHAAPAAGGAFLLTGLSIIFGPVVWALFAPAKSVPAWTLAAWLERVPTAAAFALAIGVYVYVLMRLSDRLQMHIVRATLALLFLGVFYSFGLSSAYIGEKLPYLLTVGATTTLYISAISIALAFVLALVGAIAKLSGNGIAMGIGSFYTSYFRGVPLLMQLFVIYAGLPQIGYVVDPIPAGILALSLCYGAYMTEIFRAGIGSISKGQWEAADALGLSRATAFRLVILPQAMRLIIPPTGNQFIAMLKDSSLISVVGVWDLMFVARAQGRSDFKMLEMLITASLIYWLMSILLELIQDRLEHYFGASDRQERHKQAV